MHKLNAISSLLHGVSFRDTHESLCSRAWRLQSENRFWKLWTHVFGRRHCYTSFEHYWLIPLSDPHQSPECESPTHGEKNGSDQVS